MQRKRMLAVVIVLAIAAAGCISAASVTDPTATTTSPSDDPDPETNTTTDSVVFDHAGIGEPVIEGGVVYAPENTTIRRYATIVATPADRNRFNLTLLQRVSPEAAALVNQTDLTNASLLVYQVTPDSSVPDARIEEITRSDGTVVMTVNDSATAGTADITVETVIVRLKGDDPDEFVVQTEENTTTRSG